MIEESVKTTLRDRYFSEYRYTHLGRIDFVIAKHNENKGYISMFDEIDNSNIKSILWAEAKRNGNSDILESFVQLILTIGKEKTYEKYIPPKFIGAFDIKKIAFIEYHMIQEVFFQNDFNWNVAPSNHSSKEFKQLYKLCKKNLEEHKILFEYKSQEKDLKKFISLNFKTFKDVAEKISVTKNNFAFVFQKWNEKVKPTIALDWNKANKNGIIPADFFLADLLSYNEESIKENLYVVIKNKQYELAKKTDEIGFITSSKVGFTDKQKAYTEFWAVYARPPKEEYWEYIIARRDLLVPQDIRERKGSYFTPQIWVEKSQEYLAKVLGDSWQDEYYIWDCAGGTGNLLNGLTNYDNVWISTIDEQDVNVMIERAESGWNMPIDHIFKFDFLNDDFSTCPQELRSIIADPQKRKKLVIYINPPYAEVSSVGKKGKEGVNKSAIHSKYKEYFGTAGREIYIPFLWRCYYELKNCIIGEFTKVKILQSSAFEKFRQNFTPKLLSMFIVPSWTFDNVPGKFPIGFKIWNTAINEPFAEILSDVYDEKGSRLPSKFFGKIDKKTVINKWINVYKPNEKNLTPDDKLGFLCGTNGNDFQQNKIVYILNQKSQMANPRGIWITKDNLIECAIYVAIRHCVKSTWLNDRDQYVCPIESWKDDSVFKNDCLIWTLFDNHISCKNGTNNWIPYSREQLNCKKSIKSNFMSKFLSNISLSKQAQDVYNAGLELWKYYQSIPNANPNASFHDIKLYFQGSNEKGKMEASSDDEKYMSLIDNLRKKQKKLSNKIEKKIYKYKFLK